MERRNFSKSLIMGAGLVSLASCTSSKVIFKDNPSSDQVNSKPLLKPKRLKKGDTIGIIAPASSFDNEGYEKVKANIESLGFKVKDGKNIFKKWGYLAGTDLERVDDIHAMFADENVDAIWCIRGGYGVTRLLHLLDYKLIQENPKIIIGYSDITALLHAISLRTGLVGFHGPVGKSPLNDYTKRHLENIIIDPSPSYTIDYKPTGEDAVYQPQVITAGKCEGRLSGGNLSLLSAMVGTDHHWDATGKLVFIEDIEEKPYRVDRMLTQLLQGSNLAKANGIILGVFRGCDKKEGDENSLSLMEVLQDRLGDLGIPVYYGFSFGHIHKICTLPIGINARFDTENPAIELLETAVE